MASVMKFLTFSDILYIFSQSNIQLYMIISKAFL